MKLTDRHIEPLHELLEQGSRKSQSLGSDVLVSYSQPFEAIDPLWLFAKSERSASDRWFWEKPSSGRSIVGVGTLAGTTPPRNVRFQEAERVRRQYAASTSLGASPGTQNAGPVLFAGFSFDPLRLQDRLVWQGYPSTLLLTPRLTIIREGDSHTLTINALIGPRTSAETMFNSTKEFLGELSEGIDKHRESDFIVDELPPDDASEREARQFITALLHAEAAIRDEDLEYLTVTRRRSVTTGGLFRTSRILTSLRESQPDAQIIAAGRHGAMFVGYSHDVMVKMDDRNVVVECLAARTRRGDTPEVDEALALNLAQNDDALELHELSVEARVEALEAVCDEVEEPDDPVIATSTDHHHFYTRLKGTARQETSLLQIAGSLQPLVEASGYPQETSAAFLRENEQVDRGWSAAPVGYIDLQGNGEFIVPQFSAAIRPPILEQQRAYLFTRVTVSGGIDPDDALAETERDLTTLRTAVTQ